MTPLTETVFTIICSPFVARIENVRTSLYKRVKSLSKIKANHAISIQGIGQLDRPE